MRRIPFPGSDLAARSGAIGDCSGVLWIGVSAGLLNAGVFHAISPLYRHDRAATMNLAGVMFGLGCLLTALLVAGTYFVYTVPSILILFAILPGFLRGEFAPRRKFTPSTRCCNKFRSRSFCAISGIPARSCSACCCSFNSATNGRSRAGCRCS